MSDSYQLGWPPGPHPDASGPEAAPCARLPKSGAVGPGDDLRPPRSTAHSAFAAMPDHGAIIHLRTVTRRLQPGCKPGRAR